MTERVEIGDPPPEGGINPVAPSTENVFPQGDAPTEAPTGEPRPDWLPEQFNDPKALATAYAELRSKMDAGDTAEPEAPTEGTPAVLSPETLNKYSEKYYAGGLDANDYSELEAMGVSKELVGQYAAGMSALMDRQTSAVYQEVGGHDQYEAMIGWAKESLSEQEANAFDAAVTSGDQNSVMMAVKGLAARYQGANGKEASLVQGTTQGSGEGSFTSTAQLTQAMNDPRYEKDPAYRAEVLRKMQNSSVV